MRNKSIIFGCVFVSAVTTAWLWIACESESLCQVSSGPASMPATTQAVTQPGKYRDEEKFGKEIGKPIDKGFVFINGKYIEPPYTVSRIGADVYINDILVNKNKFWPLPKYDLTKDDKTIPAEITEDMDFDEMCDILGEHQEQHFRYISANPSDKSFIDRLAEYYRQMPCVAKVDVKASDHIVVNMKNGSKSHIGGEPYKVGMPGYIMTEQHALVYASEMKDYYVEKLVKKSCLYFVTGEDGSQHELDENQTAAKLPLIIDILKSNRSNAEKRTLLVRMQYFAPWDFFAEAKAGKTWKEEDKIINTFVGGDDKFNKRLEESAKRLGIKPMTYDDIPSMEALEKEYKSAIERIKKRKLRAASRPVIRTTTATAPASSSEKNDQPAGGMAGVKSKKEMNWCHARIRLRACVFLRERPKSGVFRTAQEWAGKPAPRSHLFASVCFF